METISPLTLSPSQGLQHNLTQYAQSANQVVASSLPAPNKEAPSLDNALISHQMNARYSESSISLLKTETQLIGQILDITA